MSEKRYRVKAAAAVVKVPTHAGSAAGGAWQMIHLYQGNIVPSDVHEAQLKHLIESNIIEPIGG